VEMVAHRAAIAQHHAGVARLEHVHARPDAAAVGHEAAESEAEEGATTGEGTQPAPRITERAAGRGKGARHGRA
jgi:hypothetical protein